MTQKQQRILNSALLLFATNGYINTPTHRIAKEAEVSEGLIFKHFQNKEGLLHAIVDFGLEQAMGEINKILMINDPRKQISETIAMPMHLINTQGEFWRLQISLKYQVPEIAKKYSEHDFFKTFQSVITKAFEKMGHQQLASETSMLMMLIKGLFSLLPDMEEKERPQITRYIQSKYLRNPIV